LRAACTTERVELIDHQSFAVEEQATDQRAFSVVDAAAGDEAKRAISSLSRSARMTVRTSERRGWGEGNGIHKNCVVT
jgi:hypothetical protein